MRHTVINQPAPLNKGAVFGIVHFVIAPARLGRERNEVQYGDLMPRCEIATSPAGSSQ